MNLSEQTKVSAEQVQEAIKTLDEYCVAECKGLHARCVADKKAVRERTRATRKRYTLLLQSLEAEAEPLVVEPTLLGAEPETTGK